MSIDFNLLTRLQLEILEQSLIASFEHQELEALLAGKGFGQIRSHSRASEFPAQVRDLIENFTRKGIMNNLMSHVLRAKIEAPDLANLVQKLILTRPDPNLTSSREIVLASGFSDVNSWATSLVRMATRVCRLSCLLNGERSSGTGFLVGPDLVLTSNSVVDPWIKHNTSATDIKCNFPFAGSDPRLRVSEYSLVDTRVHCALLQLNAKVADEDRGWIDLNAAMPPSKDAQYVFLLQSPHGMPVQMATGLVKPGSSTSQIQYEARTERGASGSLVITHDLQPIGLHQLSEAVALSEIASFLGKG